MRKSTLVILAFILLIGLFFRTFEIVERFEFAHDGDLYSWIVKDIVVDHHYRLIGQLTSAPGIFIGGLFYYLLIPFFLITKMDPIGVNIFAIILGLVTTVSYYFVFAKLFNVKAGLIAAFLYASLLTIVNNDRWIVPTITVNLWVVWYFYTIIKIARGNYKLLPLLGILIGLIWHIHIALLPVLITIPIAIFLARKLPNIRQTIISFLAFILTSLPFILFEIRHGFSQTQSLISNFTAISNGPSGLNKLLIVLKMVSKNIGTLFLEPQSFGQSFNILFVVLILASGFLLAQKQLLGKKDLVIFLAWIAGVISFFGFSRSPISEYYFYNLYVIFISLASLLFYYLYKLNRLSKIFVIAVLLIIPIKNAYFTITQNYYNKGYLEKKSVVSFIKEDAQIRGFSCIGISYITTPGENVGFRYLFYLEGMHLVHPSNDIPVYNIVIPDELSLNEVKQRFGHIGVIPPTKIPTKEIMAKSCQIPNTNLTDSMFGYVE